MKKIAFMMFLAVTSIQLVSAQKPRYFTNTPLICPINYEGLALEGGLAANSKNTLKIGTRQAPKQLVSNIVDKAGTPLPNAYVVEYPNDTIFIVSRPAHRNFAFDAIQPVGSYTIIAYWRNSNEKKKKQISVYEAALKGFKGNQKPDYAINTKLWEDSLSKGQDTKSTELLIDETKGHYLIKTSDLNTFSKEFEYKKNKWSLGILLLPVKFRAWADTAGQFEFSDGFSLGTSLSWNVKHNWTKDKAWNLVLYTGISSVNVDSIKTRGVSKTEKIAAFTPAVGIMVEKSGIQLGGFIGLDFPLGAVQEKWVYRNRPWIGIGLGISIFKIQNNENANNSGQNK